MTDIEIAITEDDSLFLIKTNKNATIYGFDSKIKKILKDKGGMEYKFCPDGKNLAYLHPEYKDEMIVSNRLVLLGLESPETSKYPISINYNNFKWLNNSLIVLVHH